MKTAIIALLILCSGCTTQTTKGQCVGVVDTKKPNLPYKVSWWNLAIGVVFCETIIVPAYVLLKDLECPE